MVLDAHAQFGPSLGARGNPFGALWPLTTVRQMIDLMDEAGIERSIVFAPPWGGGDDFFDPEYRKANDAIFQGVAEFPDRLVGFARVAPRYGARAAEELNRCIHEYGASGLSLDPEAEGFSAMDERLMTPLLQRCAEHNLIVMFRCGFPPGQPAQVLPLAEGYPSVTFIIGHLGLRIGSDAAAIARRCTNVYVETSLQTASVLSALHSSLDLSRVLFGSFAPFSIPRAEIRKIEALPLLTDEQRKGILGANLATLLDNALPNSSNTRR